MFPSRPSFPTLVASAISLALAGCGGAQDGEVVVVVIDPDVEEQMLDAALAQGLVRFDAAGEIEQGLATSWHVSDDGRSYIFRLADINWADGEPVTAPAVARLLEQQLTRDSIADEFGAIEDVRAMTDKVIEIRLAAPQRNFLQLLARPELSIARQGDGTGPFTRIDRPEVKVAAVTVGRMVETPRGDLVEERVRVDTGRSAEQAIGAFTEGEADLVTGGTFATAPLALEAARTFGRPRFDPVAGLFGLVPQSAEGPLASPELRRALSAAIDRDAIISALGVRSLLPRATVLQDALDMDVRPRPPAFVAEPLEDRRAAAREALAGAELDDTEIAIALPDGPGADILFTRLLADWSAIGLSPARVAEPEQADLVLIDRVAPAANSAWFLRQFRCARVTICDAEADRLLDEARATRDPARRNALLAEAAARIEEAQLFMPIAAPVRWSLVAPGLTGFAENRFARHFIGGLREPRRR
ncbi:ABC transporter substrate-binding protein [Sphingomicrobium aestuariivivum]|uniref:ABC transporter substrate-binding protein n=1 Tax=Sphingomicrobium aestuariivivum TaxID=1582356 RepID=UPI001FD670F6|nr:ABC transporter substrate-binding protein [Sphingomicrobium aestuariivivum]MCJ8190446.1 ABC transporter substrate-binding protein [Sphingomicrobium aestuariivivum]